MQTHESFEHDPGLEYGVLAPEIAADNMAREMAKEEQPGPPEEVDLRLRLEGGREVVARVRPDKVDLSEYGTLAALPEDLRRLAGQLRELEVRSTALEALPAWVGELSRLEVLRVGVKDFLSETCPIRELPASLGALTGLQTLDLGWCKGLTALPATQLL